MLSGIAAPALLASVATPLFVAAAAAVLGSRWSAPLLRLGALVASAGFVTSAGLVIVLAGGTEVSTGTGILRLQVDALAGIMLLLIFGVSAVAQTYAVRYLAGDRRGGWFTANASLLTASSAVMVTAVAPVGIGIGWTGAGIALCALLATYWTIPAARDGVRRAAIAFLIGDAALWTAIAILTLWPSAGGIPPTLATVLIVAAVLSRSAQIPFHRWLPATLAAPTPVSALLHAGVVNAGGILLLRMSPVYDTTVAGILAVTAGSATLVYAAAVMLVKPDVKGALAHSTMAQMGFMILTCGLGLWTAAVIHLVAHGFYKAALFLSSGSAIAARRRRGAIAAGPRLSVRRRSTVLVVSATLPALALLVALAAIPAVPADHTAEYALLIFAWITGAAATWGWLRHRPRVGGAATAAAFLTATALAYVAVIRAVGHFLEPALPDAATPSAITWTTVAVTVTLLAVIAAVRSTPTGLRSALYTHALTAGHVPAPPTGAQR
ncbi:MAG: proton-conducting transporter membrane subunit [Actinomycetota bacterium]|nr:proton-conducting transporter membrane subunit [Actinomycetota bacterium]